MKQHEFDYLRSWQQMSASSIEEVISSDSIAILSRAIRMLAAKPDTYVVTKDTFATIVHQMHGLMVNGSRMLGESIAAATEQRSAGRSEDARQIYLDFLKACESRFYQDIARHQLDALQ